MSQFIHNLSCFHLLTIINSAAVSICVQVFMWTCVLISRGLGEMVTLCVTEGPLSCCTVAAPFPFPPATGEGFSFSPSSSTLVIII